MDDHVKLKANQKHTPNPKAVKAYKAAYATYEEYLKAVGPLFR
ncbi:MAG TPA: hypothetical protein PLG43_05125 [Spirochaetia bacterium]|nr:hypothetical protein [Spirochaetia bacterium]